MSDPKQPQGKNLRITVKPVRRKQPDIKSLAKALMWWALHDPEKPRSDPPNGPV